MKGSLIVVGFFALGCLLGWSGWLPDVVIENDITVYVLYLLMFQVGLSIGSDKKLKDILGRIRPKLLLVPLATIAGTLVFSALVGLLLTQWSVFDCLAVGSGFAYYSLSSILITQLKEPFLGVQLATELGTIALMANIMREIMALLGAPLFVKYFGRLSPICAGGATTMDTTLPVITRYSGKDLVFISIFHGIIVDFTVQLVKIGVDTVHKTDSKGNGTNVQILFFDHLVRFLYFKQIYHVVFLLRFRYGASY